MAKPLVSRLVLVAAIAAPLTLAFAKPATNVGRRHPNIAAAQQLVAKAYEKVEAAQRANEFDLGGHAKRAKEALELANAELKLAAQVANQR